MKKSFFVTLEGIEGVGKSTGIQVIAGVFEKFQQSYMISREPGGTSIGERIRELLLENYEEVILPESEIFLLFAARHQHIQNVVLPSLNDGKSVICDRFTDATFAYQGGGRGVELKHIEYLAQWIHPQLQPDLTLLLDASVDTALARAYARGSADRIEAEGADFFNKVRDTYLQRAKQYPERYRIIDANKPLADVTAQLESTVESWMHEQHG